MDGALGMDGGSGGGVMGRERRGLRCLTPKLQPLFFPRAAGRKFMPFGFKKGFWRKKGRRERE